MAMAVAGGLTGVFATKYVVNYLRTGPMASMLSTPIAVVIADVVVGTGLGYVIKRFAPAGTKNFGDAVMFGSWMQAGSDVIAGYAGGTPFSQLALSGMGRRGSMGMLQPGSFPVPQNPILAGNAAYAQQMMPAPAPNLAGAFPRPFGAH